MPRWLLLALLLGCGSTSPAIDEPVEEEPADDGTEVPETEPVADLKPGCTAQVTLAGHPVWVFFTRPDRPCNGVAGSGVDQHILTELVRLIGSVPAGGRIEGHIFSITVNSVAKALLDAQARGVTVRISTDGQVAASTDTAKTEYLDKLDSIVYCTSAENRACVSSKTNAISHTKLFTFSTATAPDGVVANDVVWFGSANQTYASGMKLYNNTVTIFGDVELKAKLDAYLDDLFERRQRADYYDAASGRGYLLADVADVYVSPEIETDLVVNRLNDLTPDADCDVSVMQASIRDSRLDVVDRLVRMKEGGCNVRVVAHTVEPDAGALLADANIPVREMPIHDKVFLVRGRYGDTRAFRVYTGSHNLSGSAAHAYDEIFVKLAPEMTEHPLYDAYLTHFTDAFGE